MSRVKWKIPYFRRPNLQLPRPKRSLPKETPKNLIAIIALVFTYTLFAGVIYDYIKEPLPMTSTPLGDPLAITNTLDSQYIVEGIVASGVIFAGFIGVLLIFYSKNYLHNQRFYTMLLLTGIIAVLASVLTAHYMLLAKIPG